MQLNSLSIRFYNLLKEKRKYFVYIPLASYWILLFVATSIPTDAMPKLFDAQDKLEHFGAYFILSILLLLSLHLQEKYSVLNKRAIFFTFVLLSFYGALDELHQYFIPGRYCDFYDWVADVIGGLTGIGLMVLLLRKYLYPNISL